MAPRFVNSGPFALLDMLDADGGWLTTSLLVDVSPWIKPTSVKKNLIRLRDRGLVESRPRNTHYAEPELEWKITEAGVRRIDTAVAA